MCLVFNPPTVLHNKIRQLIFQATALDHRDANASVMKFFFDLLHFGRSKEERNDFKERVAFVKHFREEYGSKLVDSLIRATVFNLPSYTFHDVGDVIFELMLLDRPTVCVWLEASLKSLPGIEQTLFIHFPRIYF